jgi:magnesium-transporting ATPase (P-type)
MRKFDHQEQDMVEMVSRNRLAPCQERQHLISPAAIPEDPPTPLWELILEQFKDQLVIILLGSAAVSFVLALFEEDGGWTAFVDPAVVR